MWKYLFFLSVVFRLFTSTAMAQNTISPITGTFIFPDFSITDKNTMDTFLNGIKALGMDTLIWNYTGVVYKNDCSGPYIEDNFFTQNRSNYLENADKLLTAAHDKNLAVFVGLAGTWNCVNFWTGDVNNSNTDAGKVVDLSRRLIFNLDQLCQNKGWDCNSNAFIKGFYIPEESLIRDFRTVGGFYSGMTRMIKSLKPNKKIMISPFQYEEVDYQTTFDDVSYIVQNLGIDIITPQDSVGSGKVTTHNANRLHFQALKNAVTAGNSQFGKSVELWANIESFSPTLDNATFPPSIIQKLTQQFQAVENLVTKKITWLYSWSFANDPLLDNNGVQYTPDYAARRKQLRSDYIDQILHGCFGKTRGDLNCSGNIDIYDFNILVANFGSTNSSISDINNNGTVDIYDYNILLGNFGGQI